MYDRRDRLRKLNHARTGYHRKTNSFIKEGIVKAGSILLKAFPKDYFIKKQIQNCKKYNNITTKRVGNFTAEARMVGEKRIFDGFVEIQFENRLFMAPKGYDKWLTAFYGDYMKLPPEEKRVPHHEFEAYFVS